jgi:hypothetical protein
LLRVGVSSTATLPVVDVRKAIEDNKAAGFGPRDRSGTNLDENLVLFGHRPLALFQPQNVWRAVSVVYHCSHDADMKGFSSELREIQQSLQDAFDPVAEACCKSCQSRPIDPANDQWLPDIVRSPANWSTLPS